MISSAVSTRGPVSFAALLELDDELHVHRGLDARSRSARRRPGGRGRRRRTAGRPGDRPAGTRSPPRRSCCNRGCRRRRPTAPRSARNRPPAPRRCSRASAWRGTPGHGPGSSASRSRTVFALQVDVPGDERRAPLDDEVGVVRRSGRCARPSRASARRGRAGRRTSPSRGSAAPSSIGTTSASPGSAPSTKNGPVSGLNGSDRFTSFSSSPAESSVFVATASPGLIRFRTGWACENVR